MSSSNAAVEGVAGALGACIGLVSTFPLQTLSTRQAVSNRSDRRETGKREVVHVSWSLTPAYTVKTGVQEEQAKKSLATYYNGIYPALLGTVTSQGAFAAFLETARNIFLYLFSATSAGTGTSRSFGTKLLRSRSCIVTPRSRCAIKTMGKPKDGVLPPLTVTQSLVVASMAGSVNVLCTNPLWLAVTRMQTASKNAEKVSFVNEIRAVYREGGFRGLWRGALPSLIMVTNPTIQYMLYEWGARWWRRPTKGRAVPGASLSSLEVFCISAVAKLGATLVTYPLLVVKNRVQVGKQGNGGGQAPTDTLSIIQQVWNQEGVFGFFKGMRPKIVQSVLAAAIMFVLKERLHSTVMQLVKVNK